MRARGILWTALAATAFAAGPACGADSSGQSEAAVQKALAAQVETERLMREQEAEAKRLAEQQRREAAHVKAIERDRSCVIKPVMSNAEIDHCKWAWGVPPPQ